MPSTGSIAILGLVDLKSAAFEFLAVQRLHSPRCIRIRHLDKAETARTPRVAIGDQRHLLDRSMRREQSAHAFLSRREGEISDVKFGHCTLLTGEFLKNDSSCICLLVLDLDTPLLHATQQLSHRQSTQAKTKNRAYSTLVLSPVPGNPMDL